MKRKLLFMLPITIFISLLWLFPSEGISSFIEAADSRYYTHGYVKDPSGLVYISYGDEIAIVGYKGKSKELDIPSYIEGVPVTILKTTNTEEEFIYAGKSNFDNVEKLTIPETVDDIRVSDFFSVNDFIVHPDNPWYESLDGNLYSNYFLGLLRCGANKSQINLPETLMVLNDYSFYNCKNIKTVDLPPNCKGYGNGVFRDSGLTEITLPERTLYIGEEAFMNCKITSIKIPDTVFIIGASAFIGTSLTKVNIPDSVEYIGDSAFAGTNLKEVNLSNSMELIEDSTFAETKLTEIKIPDSVKSIGNSAFFGTNLKEINIPNSVTSIGGFAFAGTKIKSIKFPPSLTYIGYGAFAGCNELTSAEIPSSFDSLKFENQKETYFTDILSHQGDTSYGEQMFRDCVNLTTVKIDSRIVGTGMFQGCKKLKSVTLSDRVEIIGPNAFLECKKLEKISMGSNVKIIGYYAFSECVSLKEITLPKNLTTIAGNVFRFCDKLKKITIKSTKLKKVSQYAFEYIHSKAVIRVPKSCYKKYLKVLPMVEMNYNLNRFPKEQDAYIKVVAY